MWVTLVLGIVPVVGWLLWWWNDIWYGLKIKFRGGFDSGARLPPGHMGIPLFGEMLQFLWYFKVLRRPDDFINSKRQKYGDSEGFYKSYLFGSPTIIAWSPSVCKYIINSGEMFVSGKHSVEILGATSIMMLQGTAHSRLRNFILRAINQPQPLRNIALVIQPRLIEALESWAIKDTFIAHKECRKVTFEIIGKLFVSFEPGPLLDKLDELFYGIMAGVRALPLKFPGTDYYRATQCRTKVIEIFRNELEKKKKHQKVAHTDTDDLMDRMMQLKDEDGKQLSDVELLDNICNLVVAGYESTSLSMTWALYYLAKYPDVLQKLRDENLCLSKNKQGKLITSDEISKLTYTYKVVDETIRMANIASTIFRTAAKDVVYKGYKIPKGWKVIAWVRYLHTNSENFDDPMCFNPDRWNKAVKTGTYQVFGGGSRMCAGNMLARLQLAIFLHYLATGYKWELKNPDAQVLYLSHPKPEDGAEITFSKL